MKIHLILLIGLMLVGCAKFKIESLEQDGVFNISATGFNKSQAEARWYDGANKACKFGKYDGYPGNHKTNTTQSGGSVSFVGSIPIYTQGDTFTETSVDGVVRCH